MALDAIYTMLQGEITGTLSGKYAAVQGLVSGPLQTAMAINLVICGYAIMRGVSNEPFGSYLGTWLKAYLVIMAATSSLAPQIAAAAQSLPDQLSSAMGGGALSASFDTFVHNAVEPAKTINNSMPPWEINLGLTTLTVPNLATGLMVMLVIVVAYLIAAIAMTMVLFVKLGLFVTIATMPIFVGALIFPSSSGLFFSWLGATLNYAIQTAAIAVVLVFVVNLIGAIPAAVGVGASGTTWAALEAMALQLVALFIGGFLIMQAQSIGSFAGGGGASAAGFLAALYPSTLQRALISRGIRAPGWTARGIAQASTANSNRMWANASMAGAGGAASGRTVLSGASSRPGNR